MDPPVALTVAGSDSGGGAGIQADLKTFAAQGVFGASVITAVTAQNTADVLGVERLDPAFVDLQLEAVLSDLPVAAVKTGMLASKETVAAVSKWAAAGRLPNLVVDPVMVTSTGRPLLDEDAAGAYLQLLFPHAVVVTPNLAEASLLTGTSIDDVAGMERAAGQLARTGARVVVVKGGHLAGGQAPDVVLAEGRMAVLDAARVDTTNDHGTGCSLSAAIAARLAAGDTVASAIDAAKHFVTEALRGGAGWRLGSGHGPLDHFGWAAPVRR